MSRESKLFGWGRKYGLGGGKYPIKRPRLRAANGTLHTTVDVDLIAYETKRRRRQNKMVHQQSIESKYDRDKIPKLLLPKVRRPAMYSLDGFVPKPRNHVIITAPKASLMRTNITYDNQIFSKRKDMGQDDMETSASESESERLKKNKKKIFAASSDQSSISVQLDYAIRKRLAEKVFNKYNPRRKVSH